MKRLLILFSGIIVSLNLQAQECTRSSSYSNLDINNVRAMLLNGGDMFWDQPGTENPGYEIPKGSGKNSLFAAALWLGGVDRSTGNVLVTAQTYRQSQYAYWPGQVLDPMPSRECTSWDRHFKINKTVISKFVSDYQNGNVQDTSNISLEILEWPAKNNPYINKQVEPPHVVDFNKDLAPFVDVDNDGDYNPMNGDYPDIKGDQSIWWLMNDVGNQKEFGGNKLPISDAIGLEIQVEAFAFSTDDELNDVTFQHYKLINKGNKTLDSTYVGIWVDSDLGNYADDYIGCDKTRNLGYSYNGDDFDEDTLGGYGSNVPSVGVQFCKGVSVEDDGIDNDGNGEIDNVGELLPMTNFMTYHNNFDTVSGNPRDKFHFYNYLKSDWGDGSSIRQDSVNGVSTDSTLPKAYLMYDGNPITNTGWTEESAGNLPGDRRFLMSMGPFTFNPGETKEFTFAIPWAQSSNGAKAALQELFNVADIVQQACDSDFQNYQTLGLAKKIYHTKIGNVYPTLVTDELNINVEKKTLCQFEIISSLGEIVRSEKIQNNATIGMSDLAKGMYVYRLSAPDGVQTGKIMKK